MIFKNPDELVEFFNKLDLDESTLVFKNKKIEESSGCGCNTKPDVCQCDTVTESKTDEIVVDLNSGTDSLLIESFSDNPQFSMEVVEEGQNVFYVKDFEVISNACGNGLLTLPDRTANMNMCEMEGIATVKLDVIIEGKTFNGLTFQLQKTDDTPRVVISKSQLV